MKKVVTLQFRSFESMMQFKTDMRLSSCEIIPNRILKCYLTDKEQCSASFYEAKILLIEEHGESPSGKSLDFTR